jgi:hypothetical protein
MSYQINIQNRIALSGADFHHRARRR